MAFDAVNQEWSRTGSMPEGLFGYARPLHQITLVRGAFLQGRLLRDARPVADAQIRLNQCGADSDCWFWKDATVTDDQGRFYSPICRPVKVTPFAEAGICRPKAGRFRRPM